MLAPRQLSSRCAHPIDSLSRAALPTVRNWSRADLANKIAAAIPDSMAAAGLLIGTTSFLPVPVPHASARLVAAAAARPLCRRQAACMLAVDDEFDYVIVGGGTAGCVLANRLSADERTRVLLLEPGPSARGALKVAVPVALVKLFNSKWD